MNLYNKLNVSANALGEKEKPKPDDLIKDIIDKAKGDKKKIHQQLVNVMKQNADKRRGGEIAS